MRPLIWIEGGEMSEVKRYKAVINDKPYKPYAYCEESSDGLYVRHDDYAVLQKKLDAVLAENAAIKSAIPKLKDIEYNNDNMDDVSLAEEIGFNDAVTLMNRWKGETPATDAILNAVRAEGAIACGIHLREWYDYKVEKRADDFANQLRAVKDSDQ